MIWISCSHCYCCFLLEVSQQGCSLYLNFVQCDKLYFLCVVFMLDKLFITDIIIKAQWVCVDQRIALYKVTHMKPTNDESFDVCVCVCVCARAKVPGWIREWNVVRAKSNQVREGNGGRFQGRRGKEKSICFLIDFCSAMFLCHLCMHWVLWWGLLCNRVYCMCFGLWPFNLFFLVLFLVDYLK